MELSDKEEGKRVVNREGQEVGMVSKVEGHRAHVDPDPGLTDTIKSKLGWGDADEDMYPIDESDVETITDDEIKLKR